MQKKSIIFSLNLATELVFNYNLHPAIITACRNLDELDIYLDCLENKQLSYICFKYENENIFVEKSELFAFCEDYSKKENESLILERIAVILSYNDYLKFDLIKELKDDNEYNKLLYVSSENELVDYLNKLKKLELVNKYKLPIELYERIENLCNKCNYDLRVSHELILKYVINDEFLDSLNESMLKTFTNVEKLLFYYYPNLKEGKFDGKIIEQNKEAGRTKYELELPADEIFKKIHGHISVIYTVNEKEKVIPLNSIYHPTHEAERYVIFYFFIIFQFIIYEWTYTAQRCNILFIICHPCISCLLLILLSQYLTLIQTPINPPIQYNFCHR